MGPVGANGPITGFLLKEARVVSERSEGDCGAALQPGIPLRPRRVNNRPARVSFRNSAQGMDEFRGRLRRISYSHLTFALVAVLPS